MKPLPLVTAVVLLLAAGQVSSQVVTPGIVLPPRDRAGAAAPAGTARVRGRIVAAETGAPLRRAQVTLLAGEIGVRRLTTTDADGRYEFSELPAGRYVISASKGGYVTLQVGQRRPFEPGTPMSVGDAQTMANVDLALPRGSVIAGRVTDEFGEPLAGAQVQALRYQYRPGGRRQLTFAGGPFVQTDDLGQFRLYGLMPGEYLVSASLRQFGIAIGGGTFADTSEGYAPTYYPGTANPAEAQPVAVALGQEPSVHIALAASRMARVSGTVVDSRGQPAAGGMVMLRPGSGGGMMMIAANAQVGADGTFAMTNVPPGEHVVEVRSQARGPDVSMEFASVPVTVATDDLTGLRITTSGGTTIRGRLVWEGTAPRSGGFAPVRVFPQSAESDGPVMFAMGGPSRANGTVADDGSFELSGITGRVLFRVTTPPAWTLKSVTIDGEDVTDVPLDLGGARTIADVRVVLTDRLTEVAGGVTDARGEALEECVVVLLPEEQHDGAAATRYTRVLRPDQEGRYRVRGLPPGRYVAVAVPSLEQGQEWDPDVQRRLRDAGRAVTLAEGQHVALDLKLTGGV